MRTLTFGPWQMYIPQIFFMSGLYRKSRGVFSGCRLVGRLCCGWQHPARVAIAQEAPGLGVGGYTPGPIDVGSPHDSTTCQRPPLAGPTRLSLPSFRNLAICFSTALGVIPNLSAISRADRVDSILTKDKIFSELFSELSSSAGVAFKLELTATVLAECHLRLQFAEGHRANSDSHAFQCLTPSFAAASRIICSTALNAVNTVSAPINRL